MSKGKWLAVTIIWLVVFSVLAASWRWLAAPALRSREATRREARQTAELQDTSSPSHYQHHLTLALDSFSGYAILRCPEFQHYASQKRIHIELTDDQADYRRRLERLDRGEVDLAAFTIDALIKTSAELGKLPATVVAIIDETRGADAMVADRAVAANVDALNRADMRFVLVPDSPSETLARVVMADFQLDNLPPRPLIAAKDAKDVVARYRDSRRDAPRVYVLWEPYVSQITEENDNMHVVVDSSRFRGYIVDVLVARRDFLLKNRDVVQDIVQCYFRAAYQYRDTMPRLVRDDARRQAAPLSDRAVEKLVRGIWWKNTQENFAHMGLAGDQPLQHIEDMIANITQVLVHTNAIASDPTGGRPNLLYFSDTLQAMQTSQFHPGLNDETVRDETVELPALSADQWQQLVEVGTLQVPRLVFARGSARLTATSQHVLDDLASKLKTWPRYYVLIRGNASTRGDAAANAQLATRRAAAAEQYLIKQGGIRENRVRAVGVKPSGSTSVSFLLGQPPY